MSTIAQHLPPCNWLRKTGAKRLCNNPEINLIQKHLNPEIEENVSCLMCPEFESECSQYKASATGTTEK